MPGISTLPKAVASATAEPETPEKTMQDITVVRPSPPLNRPTQALAKLMMRAVMPPTFMMASCRTSRTWSKLPPRINPEAATPLTPNSSFTLFRLKDRTQ